LNTSWWATDLVVPPHRQAHGIAALDQELYADFEDLRAARVSEDERLGAVIDSYAEADLAKNLSYRNMAGEEKSLPMAQVLGHIFNHQTHHRGQVHGLLSATLVHRPHSTWFI